jgi:hypothetical protein
MGDTAGILTTRKSTGQEPVKRDSDHAPESNGWSRFWSFLIVLYLVGGASYLALIQRAAELAGFVSACGVALLALNMHRLSKIKAGSIEAELNATRAARQETYATLAHVRGIARQVTKLSLDLLAREGRFSMMNDLQRMERRNEMLAALSTLELTTEELRSASEPFDELWEDG